MLLLFPFTAYITVAKKFSQRLDKLTVEVMSEFLKDPGIQQALNKLTNCFGI